MFDIITLYISLPILPNIYALGTMTDGKIFLFLE